MKSLMAGALVGISTVALAQAAPEPCSEAAAANAPVYALISAIGGQFSVVYEVPQVGSRLPPYRRTVLDVPNQALNLLVLQSLDRAIGNVRPDSKRVYMALDAAIVHQSPPAYREAAALELITSTLAKSSERLKWERFVVVTPAYEALQRDGLASQLHGIGLFSEPLCQGDDRISATDETSSSCSQGFRTARGVTTTNSKGELEQSNFFIAPYSYIQIWLLDPKTLNLIEKRRVTENKKLFNSDNRTIDVN
jgi:hypothetical protein